MVQQQQNMDNAQEFFGESGHVDRPNAVRRGRVSSVGEVVVMKKKKGRSKLRRQNTMVRQQVESLPTFWPIFIFGVTFVQVVVVIVLLILRGLAPINIFPQEYTQTFPSLMNETANETVTYYRYTNPWIGIGVLDLIQCGAKFTPCMRQDQAIINRNLVERALVKEKGGYGCCRNNLWVGTTTEDECAGTYTPGTTCDDTSALLPNFHPCCIGITGTVMNTIQCVAQVLCLIIAYLIRLQYCI